MIEIKTKLRKWGNSFGIIVPQKDLKNFPVKVGEEVTVMINQKKINILKESFGTLKSKKTVSQLMKEMDNELYND